jgi:hypothetical protein
MPGAGIGLSTNLIVLAECDLDQRHPASCFAE